MRALHSPTCVPGPSLPDGAGVLSRLVGVARAHPGAVGAHRSKSEAAQPSAAHHLSWGPQRNPSPSTCEMAPWNGGKRKVDNGWRRVPRGEVGARSVGALGAQVISEALRQARFKLRDPVEGAGIWIPVEQWLGTPASDVPLPSRLVPCAKRSGLKRRALFLSSGVEPREGYAVQSADSTNATLYES